MPLVKRVGFQTLVVGQPAAAGDITPPGYSASEEGDVTHATVAVTFTEAVNSDLNDYVTGVTVKYNAVTQTISSGTRQVDQSKVHYVIAAAPDNNDTITWEYSDAVGDIEDLANNQLGDVTAQTSTNNLGTHAIFDNEMDSGHLITVGLCA